MPCRCEGGDAAWTDPDRRGRVPAGDRARKGAAAAWLFRARPRIVGEKALSLLDGEQPDFALLDVDLKGEHAGPVAAALQARGVPFVLITGYNVRQLNDPALRDAPRLV